MLPARDFELTLGLGLGGARRAWRGEDEYLLRMSSVKGALGSGNPDATTNSLALTTVGDTLFCE